VIVVNDGSKDDTMERLRAAFDLYEVPRTYPDTIATRPLRAVYRSRSRTRLAVLDKENGGKADSLNAAINASRFPLVIAVDANPRRLEMARTMGADIVIDYTQEDPVAKVKALTEGRGADVAIEALGIQETFENCLKTVRPAGTVSSLGVYGDKVTIPLEPFIYGIGDIDIRTTLCPGGKERMRTLMEMVRHGRLDLEPLITHRFALDQIEEAYDLFGNQREGVVKVGLTP